MNNKMQRIEFNSIIYLVIRAAFVGITLINLIYISHQDAYLALIVASILGLIPFYFYMRIIKSKKTFLELFESSFGKIIKWIIFIIVFLYCVLIFWNLINFISSQYLFNTPRFVIGLVFIIPIIYLNIKGVRVIGRISLFLIYISIFLFLIALFGLIFQTDFSNVLPFMESRIPNLLYSTLSVISYCVSPLLFLTVIPKDELDKKISFKSSLPIYFWTFFTLFWAVFLIICVYGYRMALLLDYPAFQILKRISIVSFVERIEHFLFMRWIFDIFICLSLGVNFMKSYFNKKSGHIPLYLICILLFICSINLFRNKTAALKYILNLLPSLFFIFLIILPIIIYLIKKRSIASFKNS